MIVEIINELEIKSLKESDEDIRWHIDEAIDTLRMCLNAIDTDDYNTAETLLYLVETHIKGIRIDLDKEIRVSKHMRGEY